MNLGDAVVAIFDYLSQENCPLSDIEKQFFFNHQNHDGNTALHLACIKDLQTISSIIEARGNAFGLDLSLKNKKGQTPTDIRQQG
jgi:ankyrin repeat protein